MSQDTAPLERAEGRILVLSRQLKESAERESELREEIDAAQRRISQLYARLGSRATA